MSICNTRHLADVVPITGSPIGVALGKLITMPIHMAAIIRRRVGACQLVILQLTKKQHVTLAVRGSSQRGNL